MSDNQPKRTFEDIIGDATEQAKRHLHGSKCLLCQGNYVNLDEDGDGFASMMVPNEGTVLAKIHPGRGVLFGLCGACHTEVKTDFVKGQNQIENALIAKFAGNGPPN